MSRPLTIERLNTRQKPLGCEELLLDSQAFMKLRLHGCYPSSPQAYARKVERVARLVKRVTAVTEDYMCEPFMLAKTGLSIADHQRLTIERFDAIRTTLDPAIELMPVLQGYLPREYVDHIRQYGERLPHGSWVGVGSICKRNTDVRQLLSSADSLAWSYHARRNGRSANDWREAARFAGRVDGTAPLGPLFEAGYD